jgi:hypothetical protein
VASKEGEKKKKEEGERERKEEMASFVNTNQLFFSDYDVMLPHLQEGGWGKVNQLSLF